MADPEDRINIPLDDTVGFYTQALVLGIGLPVHPFFISILDSCGIASGQLTHFVWCHMLGTYLIWDDLGYGEPNLNIWHHLYKIHRVSEHPGFYFFSKWPKGGPMLLNDLPSSNGNWRTRFFYLDIATGGPGLHDGFADASRCIHFHNLFLS